MKIAVIVLALVAVATAIPRPIGSHRPGFGTNLVGGEEAKEKEFPFSVILEYRLNDGRLPLCSGVIYDETRIITSAYCTGLVAYGPNETMTLVAGAHDINNPSGEEQERSVISLFTHEDYNANTNDNDIGILTLDSPLIFTDRVQPIRLAQSNEFPSGDVVTCGHGAAKEEAFTWYDPLLLKATLEALSLDECKQRFDFSGAPTITESMICAVAPGTGLAIGDSGDPLIAKDEAGLKYLAGVGSFWRATSTRLPSVFTAIAPFRQWLDSKLNA